MIARSTDATAATKVWGRVDVSALSSSILVLACILATVFYVGETIWGAQHPLNTSEWDDRWRVIGAVWATTLTLLLLANRQRAANVLIVGLLASVVSAIALFGAFLWPIVTAIWFVTLAAVTGNFILNIIIRNDTLSFPDRVALGVPLGFAGLSLVFFGLAAAQAFSFSTVNGTLLLLTGAMTIASRHNTWQWPTLRVNWEPGRLETFVTGASAAFLLGGLLLAVAPETMWDAINYQLSVPAQYVRLGGLVELPWNFTSYLVGNVNFIYAAAMLVSGQPAPQVLHVLTAGILAFQAFAAGSRWFDKRVAWLGAMLVSTTPILQEFAGVAYIDVFAAIFGFSTLYAALIWFDSGEPSWLLVCGILAGAAFAAKMNAVTILAPVALLVLVGLFLARATSIRLTGYLLIAGFCLAVAVTLPWVAMRWHWTGNPVFPFLNNVFRSPLWPTEGGRSLGWDLWGIEKGPIGFLRLPWDVTKNASHFGEALLQGGAGALFLLVPPLFLLFLPPERWRPVVALAATTVASLICWFALVPYIRYSFAIFPGLALLTAANLVAAYDRLALRPSISQALPVAVLLVGGLYLYGVTALAAVSHDEYPERYRVSVAFGRQTAAEYLNNLPYMRAFRWLNERNDADLRVLSLSDGARFNMYLDGHLMWEQDQPTYPPLQTLPQDDPAELASALRGIGIDYLLIATNAGKPGGYVPHDPLLIDAQRFLSAYAHKEYADDSYVVYRLLNLDEIKATGSESTAMQANSSVSIATPAADTTAERETTLVQTPAPSEAVNQLNDTVAESTPISAKEQEAIASHRTRDMELRLDSVDPHRVRVNSGSDSGSNDDLKLAITGSGFSPGMTITIDGVSIATEFHSATELIGVVPPEIYAEAGVKRLLVLGPRGRSNSLAWTVTGNRSRSEDTAVSTTIP
jgi:hypothetical protein